MKPYYNQNYMREETLEGDIIMLERKIFCDECRNDVNYIVENAEMRGTLKGETYTYSGKIACCIDCNSEVYVDKINDYNLKVLYDKYREKQ